MSSTSQNTQTQKPEEKGREAQGGSTAASESGVPIAGPAEMAAVSNKFSYGIIAIQENKILVIHQKNGDQWTLCKGGFNPRKDSDPFSTAQRELLEETHLHVERENVLVDRTFVQEYAYDRMGLGGTTQKIHKKNEYYIAKVHGQARPDKKEVDGLRWAPIEGTVEATVAGMDLTHEEDARVVFEALTAAWPSIWH